MWARRDDAAEGTGGGVNGVHVSRRYAACLRRRNRRVVARAAHIWNCLTVPNSAGRSVDHRSFFHAPFRIADAAAVVQPAKPYRRGSYRRRRADGSMCRETTVCRVLGVRHRIRTNETFGNSSTLLESLEFFFRKLSL